jgi:hypothetical protein
MECGGMAVKRGKTQNVLLPPRDELVSARKTICSEMLDRKVGFYWNEVETHVGMLVDFYYDDVRSEKLLKRGLECLEYVEEASMKAGEPS